MSDAALLFEFVPDGILTESHIFIPGLIDHETGAALVMPRERTAWQAWAKKVLVHREVVAHECVRDLEAQRIQRALCRQPHGLGAAYFLITFGWIYEPRDDDAAMVPFILYPAQVELLLALDGAMQRPKGQYSSVAIPKARGVGATWLDAGAHLWRWLFAKHYQGRLVSRTEDMVDKRGSSDAWMWKLDYLVDRLPYWFLPEQYATTNRQVRSHMMMLNPANGNAISGEAKTSGIGVGGRATKYSIDEAARFDDLDLIWGQLSETTNHRVAISTHNIERTTHFWDMVGGHNGWETPLVVPLPWRANLMRDDLWLEETRHTMRKDLFEREILMNPWAGISSWVYPEAKRKQPAYRPYRPDGGLVLHGLDDGWDDEFALVWVQQQGERWVVLDGYQNSHKTIGYYGHLLRGELTGAFAWDDEAVRLARWVHGHETWRGLFYGDRHGDNTDITSGTSAWEKLRGEFGLAVMTNPPNRNDYLSRRQALQEWLDRLDFADTPGAVAVLDAVQNHRFPTPRAGAQPTAEYRKPVHDQTSHYVTALEYIAAHLELGHPRLDAGADRPRSVRNDFLQPHAARIGRRQSPERELTYRWLT